MTSRDVIMTSSPVRMIKVLTSADFSAPIPSTYIFLKEHLKTKIMRGQSLSGNILLESYDNILFWRILMTSSYLFIIFMTSLWRHIHFWINHVLHMSYKKPFCKRKIFYPRFFSEDFWHTYDWKLTYRYKNRLQLRESKFNIKWRL